MIDYKILDAWEARYIKNLPDKELLAWSDAEAVKRYPDWRWVYDKYELHKYLEMVPTWDLWNNYPVRYPKFVKPRFNVNGLGFGSGLIDSEFDVFDKGLCGSHIAQCILTGEHISSDVVFDGDELIDYYSFVCHYDRYGSLILFESTEKKPPKKLLEKMSKIGRGRRVMNVETIGNKPLEIHLRPSIQFYDISGGLLKNLPSFIKGDSWNKVHRGRTYSRVFRRREDARAARPRSQPKIPKGVRSVQYCWEKQQKLSKHGQDGKSFRYMVINGSNLRAIEDYARKLKPLIKFYS